MTNANDILAVIQALAGSVCILSLVLFIGFCAVLAGARSNRHE